LKKQQVSDGGGGLSKQVFIRNKVFSLKTPLKEGDPRDRTQTRDITALKDPSNSKT
jgi:hypothetical protein